jgi:hypothetical protein
MKARLCPKSRECERKNVTKEEEEDTEILAQFHEHHAEGTACVKATEARLAALAGRVPAPVLEYFRAHGWCSYRNGLLWTVDPNELEDVKQDWRLSDGAIIFGRSGFGDLLVISGDRMVVVFVHTGRAIVSQLSYSEYLASQLLEEDVEGLFFGELYQEAVRAHGAPTSTEMFTFEPALALGGETILEDVRRVPMKPALAFLSQLHEDLIPY